MRSKILIIDDDEKIISMLRRGWHLKGTTSLPLTMGQRD